MGQRDAPKQPACVQLVVTRGVWEVNVKRGSQNNRYGVMCSVIGYEGDSHPGRGKRESMITDLGNIKEFMHGGRGLIGREKIHRDGLAL